MSVEAADVYENCQKYLNFMHVFIISTDDQQSDFAQIVVFNAVQQN